MRLSPRVPWYCLLSAVVLVPLAVGVIPISGIPLSLNAFVAPKLVVMCVALGLALGSWALTSLRSGTLYAGRGLIPVAVFLGIATLAAIFGLDARLAVFGDFEQGVGLVVYALCALMLYLITQVVRDQAHLRTLTTAALATAIAIAVIGLLQQIFAADLLGFADRVTIEWIVQRGYSTIGNPDSYAAYLVLPAILVLHRLRYAGTSRDRVLLAAGLVAILISLVMAQTRAPILGLIVGGAGYAIFEFARTRRAPAPSKSKKKATTERASDWVTIAVVAGAVAAGAASAALLATATDIGQRFTSPGSLVSLGGRGDLWANALRIIAAHPILGVGPDSFRLGWYGVREVSHLAAGTGLVITDPHSVPLFVASTMGILGLIAALYLVGSSFFLAFRVTTHSDAERSRRSDYIAWLFGAGALAVTLVASMLTSVSLFALFSAFGVLIAPTLHAVPAFDKARSGRLALQIASLLAAVALVVFGLLTAVSQSIAVGARTDNAQLAKERALRAASIAPWDTGLRNLKFETMVQAALESAFTDATDASQDVTTADSALAAAEASEPDEFVFPYRRSLLLIGSGQKLGPSFTTRGIESGLRALVIYPNSLEVRTGVATGYLQLEEPAKAEAILTDVWDADPAYLPSGSTYVEALLAQDKREQAISALARLKERFPDDPTVLELEKRVLKR